MQAQETTAVGPLTMDGAVAGLYELTTAAMADSRLPARAKEYADRIDDEAPRAGGDGPLMAKLAGDIRTAVGERHFVPSVQRMLRCLYRSLPGEMRARACGRGGYADGADPDAPDLAGFMPKAPDGASDGRPSAMPPVPPVIGVPGADPAVVQGMLFDMPPRTASAPDPVRDGADMPLRRPWESASERLRREAREIEESTGEPEGPSL